MFVPLTPLRCLYRAVDLYGGKVGIVGGDCRFTYAEFGERCERLAGGLIAQGVRAGDRIAFLSFNNHRLLEGYFGVPLAGATVMPLNVRLTPAELIQILNHSGACMLLFENDFAPLIEHFRKACPSITRYVTLDGNIPAADLTYEELLVLRRLDRPDVMSFDEGAIAELFYTSGSTGAPKGVMLSHRTLYLHALSVLGSETTHSDNNVELHTIPLFHANAWGRPHFATMNGLKQVMVRRFDPALVCRLIQEEGATQMGLVPTMANALLNFPDLGRYNFSSMRTIFIGGAASSPELIGRMEQAFGCTVMAGYGLTETAPVASSGRPKGTLPDSGHEERLRRQAMAGWPLPGVEIRVVDIQGADVPRDGVSIGEVVIRGDEVMDGYYQDPAATKAAIGPGGWLHTGDMAVWDEERYIHIVDRKKDIIISGGENISSIEVERAIASHPDVLECAVVSAPDPQWGEVPAAFVVPKEGRRIGEADLIAWLEGRIARFKCPRRIRVVESALPKTGTGKILKRELREQFWEGMTRRVQG
jgi:fatty-acyl-CoA synthase